MRIVPALLVSATLLGCISGEIHTGGGESPAPTAEPSPMPPIMVTPPHQEPPDAGVPLQQPPTEVDDAVLVSANLPTQLGCAERLNATVTMKNTGNTVWTRAGGYRLGAVGDADPLSAVGRIDLASSERVEPGQTATFTLTLEGPRVAGMLLTDWQMLREDVRWFGATSSQSVTVTACNEDAIDLNQVQVFNSPADVASWPITTHITQLEMHPEGDVGVVVTFPAQQTWPDYTPPGWDGPLQYTVWAVLKINGAWYTSGYIQMWRGRYGTGAPLISSFARDWAYDGRWGPMMGHSPVVAEQVGFFVTAGNARGIPEVTSVRERSNVVVVSLPAGDTGTFMF